MTDNKYLRNQSVSRRTEYVIETKAAIKTINWMCPRTHLPLRSAMEKGQVDWFVRNLYLFIKKITYIPITKGLKKLISKNK